MSRPPRMYWSTGCWSHERALRLGATLVLPTKMPGRSARLISSAAKFADGMFIGSLWRMMRAKDRGRSIVFIAYADGFAKQSSAAYPGASS